MNDNLQNTVPDPTLRPLHKIRFMSDDLLEVFNTQCHLNFPLRVLSRIMRHFNQVERRDPSLYELRFLRAMLDDRRRSPSSVYLDDYTPADQTQARILADALRMHRALSQATPGTKLTLPRLLNTAAEYLSRAGVLPRNEKITWTPIALAPQNAPVCGDMALIENEKQSGITAEQHVLLCFTPTNPAQLDEELNDFLDAANGTSVRLHAVVGAQGILPHLFSLEGNVSLNLAALSVLPADAPLDSLLAPVSPFALLVSDEQTLPTLFATSQRLSVCGSRKEGNCVSFYRGAQRLACFEKSILSCLNVLRKPSATEEDRTDHVPTVLSQEIIEKPDTLCATLCVKDGCLEPLLALLGELAEKGADFTAHSCTLCLNLPTVDLAGKVIADALPLALEWHRVAAELSLTSINNLCIPCENSTRLHLYFESKRKAPRPEGFGQAWSAAAKAGDFGTLRMLLYKD